METMNSRSSARPLVFLGAAALLGVLGEYLFVPEALGLNVLVWAAALTLALIVLSRLLGSPLRGEGRWLLAPALLFAGFVAWRASPTLQAINLAAVAGLLAVAAFRMREGRVRVGAVSEYFWLAATATLTGMSGLPRMLWAAAREHAPVMARAERSTQLIRAMLLTVPVLLVFGALLASADELFADALGTAVFADVSDEIGHVIRAMVWAWIAGGFLYASLVHEPAPLPHVGKPALLRLGPIEISTVLGLLDLLFLVFVVFQVRYLFGGEGHVEVTEGLTYAEYARQGFFELLAVAALVVPLVLGVHWLLREQSPAARVAFRIAAAALLVLVYAIVASALQRMRVYVDEFGLTQLRLYSTVFMFWLVVALAWLGATVLRDRRRRFASGAIAAALVAGAALNAMNPDAFIVDTNLDQRDERPFDTAYALELGADATPTIVNALARLTTEQRCALAAGLEPPEPDGWRTWNYGRERAADALSDGRSAIEAACQEGGS